MCSSIQSYTMDDGPTEGSAHYTLNAAHYIAKPKTAHCTLHAEQCTAKPNTTH